MRMVQKRHVIGRRDQDWHNTEGWALEMPVGSRIVGIDFFNSNLIATVLQPAKGVNVPHDLLVVTVDKEFELLIGRTVGDFFGRTIIRTPETAVEVSVYQCCPWPTSSITTPGHG